MKHFTIGILFFAAWFMVDYTAYVLFGFPFIICTLWIVSIVGCLGTAAYAMGLAITEMLSYD